MSNPPWLTIIGLGEDGPEGLSDASRDAIMRADVVMGAARHLGVLPDLGARGHVWPVPFAEGIADLAAMRGRNVVVLASGDPFWHGAGAVLARHFEADEWIAHPAPSTLSWAAARLGWPLQNVTCLGLHAAPIARMRRHVAAGRRLLLTLRDGAAVGDVAVLLSDWGFGDTVLHVLEALGGPRERLRQCRACAYDFADVAHPVCLGLDIAGDGAALGHGTGRADAFFANDGQITKRPMRAVTLSSLAPVAGECLWDLGAGSGSIALEWLLAHPDMRAICVEQNADRAARIRENADALGVMPDIRHALSLAVIKDLPPPDAVFIGGGVSQELFAALWATVPDGTRIVANAVTLESEALLGAWARDKGGDLLRIETASIAQIGRLRGWKSAYPVVQWSVRR